MKSSAVSISVGVSILVAAVMFGEGISRMQLPSDDSVPLALISYATRLIDVASNLVPGFAAAMFLGKGSFRLGAIIGFTGTILCYAIFGLALKVDLGPYYVMNIIFAGSLAAITNGIGALGAHALLIERQGINPE